MTREPSQEHEPAEPRSRARRAFGHVTRELGALWHDDQKLAPLVGCFFAFGALGVFWDMPGAYGWENDGAAPRDLFGGLGNNLTPGKGHRYPLFHYLVLGCLVSPVLLIDVVYAWVSGASLEQTVVSLGSMTAIALVSKFLNLVMMCIALLALGRSVRRSWSPAAGRWAVIFAGVNLSVGYYGRVTNMDGPYLMWTALAIDRLLGLAESGRTRDYGWFGFFVAASMATKDQAYASYTLVGPLYLVLIPLVRPGTLAAGSEHFGKLVRAIGVGTVSYALLSGALLNPTGFLTRLKLLTGENSQDWKTYESSLGGLWQNTKFILEHQADYWWPWPVVAAAWLGVGLGLLLPASAPLERRLWRLLPLCAGVSSTLGFTLVVGRDAHRFVLPLGFWLSGYAGASIALLSKRAAAPKLQSTGLALGTALAGLGLGYSLELLVSQWWDARRDVERYLSALPRGSRVETYGLGVYLPRFDLGPHSNYSVTHVRADPKSRPPVLVGLHTLVDDYAAVARRQPDVLVIPEAFAERYLPKSTGAHRTSQKVVDRYRQEPGALEFFPAAAKNSLGGYRRLSVGEPSPPSWYRALGGRVIRVHGSTGQAIWVLARQPAD